MTAARWLTAAALTAAGGALVWLFEPGIAWTAVGLVHAILAYAGALALGIGVCLLAFNDAVERAGKRLLIHSLKRGAPHD